MKRFLLLFTALTLLSPFSYAQTPKTLSYQGLLTGSDGKNVADGEYTIGFKLYDSASGGIAFWEETQSLTTQNGIFNAILGTISPLDMPFDKPYWLGITVDNDEEMLPRIALTASAYTLSQPESVAKAEQDTMHWKVNQNHLFYKKGNIGIAAMHPRELLQLGDFNSNTDNYLKIATTGVNTSNPAEDRFAGIKLRHFDDKWGATIESWDGSENAGLNFKTHYNDSVGKSSLFISRIGYVGFGTTTPTNNLQLGDFSTSSDQFFSVNTAGGQVFKSGIELKHYSEEAGFTIYSDDGSSSGAIGLHVKRHHPSFPEGGIQSFTIDRLSGNIGINTTVPQQKLDIFDGSIQLTDTGSVNALVNRPFIYFNQVGESGYGGGLIWQNDGINEMEMFYSNDNDEVIFYDNDYLWIAALRDTGSFWTRSVIEPSGIRFRDGSLLTSANFETAWGSNSGNLFYNSGNVGLGTNSPETSLHILKNDTNAVVRIEAPGSKYEARLEFKKFGTLGDAAIGFYPGNADLRFRTKGSTAFVFEHDEQETMRIHANGNLGLGTKNPMYKLDVKGNARLGSGQEASVLYFDEIEGAKWNLSTEGYRFSFLNNENIRNMVIYQDGNVGIGVDVPGEKLVVNGNLVAKNISLEHEGRGALFFATPYNYDLALYNNQASLDGDGLTDGMMFNIGEGLNIRTGWSDSKSSALYIKEDGKVGINTGSDVQLQLAIGDSDTGLQQQGDGELSIYTNFGERIRINANGDVGIGVNTMSHPLELASGAHVTAGGVWTNASSRTLKENIKELNPFDAINALLGLKPVTYNYLSEKDESYVGFIAEDVPSIVAMNDRKSLSSMDIVALLTKVVQEQQKSIEDLSKELELLKKALNQD